MKLLMFLIIFFTCLFLTMSNLAYAANAEEVKLIKLLDSIPDNEIAACKVRSNDFIFFCHLNKRTYYDCRVGIGFNFTLPKCEPVPCGVKSEPVVDITKSVPVSNPFLDMLKGIKK